MERRYFESRRDKKDSFLEKYFFLEGREFERETGIPERQLTRLSYSVEKNRFREVAESETKRGLEVLWNRETSTLIVPPPAPGLLTIENLAAMTLPVVGFIDEQKPDVVVGCDRGARIYAIAVHSMWGNLKDHEQRFPTLDSKLHFARLSTSLGLDITSQALARILETSGYETNGTGERTDGKRPRVMFIDDLVASGATRRHILKSLKEIGILPQVDVSFAVMCGSGADVAGSGRRVDIPWHDDPEVIGVNYTRDGKPFPVRTEQARQIRQEIHQATKELTAKLQQNQ